MLAIVTTNDQDWNEKLEGAKYIGRTIGCGCCATWEKITPENLQKHINSLREKLEYAEEILAEIS